MRLYSDNREFIHFYDRLISIASYLTMGFFGFIWLIISHITGKNLKTFTRFNIFQSIFISILLYLIRILFDISISVVKIIPFVGTVFINIVYYLTAHPFIFGFTVLGTVFNLFMAYLVITCLQGKYPEIPWISNTVRRMI